MDSTAVMLFGVTNFIANNPGFAAWVLGGLITAIVSLVIAHYGYIAKRISSLEAADEVLAERVGGAEKILEGYREHVGAGDREIASMNERIRDHMEREEKEVWGGLRDLGKQLGAIQVENISAHAQIGERLAKVETQMRVEAAHRGA